MDLSMLMKGAGLGGGVMGALGLFGGKRFNGPNPADAANQYLNQIPGQTKQYFQPYMDAGNQSMQQLMGILGQNPTDRYNQFASGYKESPGYQFQLQQALKAGGNAAAAGGMLGTPQHEQQSMDVAQGLASRDYENYLKNVLGLDTERLQGLGDMTKLGYGASTGYGEGLANLLGSQAQYAYGGQAGQNQARQQNWSNIFSALPWLFA